MKISRTLPLVALFCGALLVTSAAGCGGPKAPESPKALAELVVKAFAEGNADAIKVAVPTKEDFIEASAKAGEEVKPEKMDKMIAKTSEKVAEAFTKIAAEAKEAKVDWSKVTVGEVAAKEKKEKDLVGYRITATLTSGDDSYEMRLRAAQVDRGLILTRAPRIKFGGLCDKVVANLMKVAASAEDDFAKKMVEEFAGKTDKMVRDCERQLERKPEQRAEIACQATAASFKAFMECGKK